MLADEVSMSDSNPTTLTEEQKDAAIKWLTDKKSTAVCPMCQNPNWVIADSLTINPMFAQATGITLAAGYPAVVVVCNNCAFLRFHSAVAMGIVPAPQEAGRAPSGLGAVLSGVKRGA